MPQKPRESKAVKYKTQVSLEQKRNANVQADLDQLRQSTTLLEQRQLRVAEIVRRVRNRLDSMSDDSIELDHAMNVLYGKALPDEDTPLERLAGLPSAG